ncbi:metal-sensitive transcriptional regulator [Peptacetobacter sp.]|uniref:metal-sensitive transcriptional regulator n=1 Tax=Peptacetobacter sp. TaxID=2991975 RepID=UPI00261281FE|nr:metal-sensitive transcriptional regulator [Peptacetobacter sp.]
MEKNKCTCCCNEDNEERKLSDRNNKKDLIKRLNRIEGQVKGIQKMIDDDRYCIDILVQISAAKAAIDKVGKIILENHIKGCVTESIKHESEDESDRLIEELMKNIYKFMK